MNKEAIKQRKLLVQKLKERGVSVTNPLFEHGVKVERISSNLSRVPRNKLRGRSCNSRAAYGAHSKGRHGHMASTSQAKVIIKHLPVTLSIAELSKATGMFKGTGGTPRGTQKNVVADEFEKANPDESRKTQNKMQYYYVKFGKGWKKNTNKPVDSPES